MPVSQTSMQAYAAIQKKLSANQSIVYNAIRKHPLASNRDIADDLGWPINTVTPRCNELRQLGLVELGGTKRSRTTGISVQWMYAVG